MGAERGTQLQRPAARRRFSLLQISLLLPMFGLATAVLLGTLQMIWSFVATTSARNRGSAEACDDFLPEVRSDEIEIVSRAPWGYACEAELPDGAFAVQEHPSGTSILFFLSVALVAASIVTLIGVVFAIAAKWLIATLFVRSDGSAFSWLSWGTGLLVAACFLTPWTFLAQYLQWYSASKSDGSAVCPSSYRGEEILGYSVEARYVPPHLTCSGDTVTGLEFTTTSYGFPFYAFLGCLALATLAVGILIAARLLPKKPTG